MEAQVGSCPCFLWPGIMQPHSLVVYMETSVAWSRDCFKNPTFLAAAVGHSVLQTCCIIPIKPNLTLYLCSICLPLIYIHMFWLACQTKTDNLVLKNVQWLSVHGRKGLEASGLTWQMALAQKGILVCMEAKEAASVLHGSVPTKLLESKNQMFYVV